MNRTSIYRTYIYIEQNKSYSKAASKEKLARLFAITADYCQRSDRSFARWPLCYTNKGKPYFAAEADQTPPDFSVSNSGELIVYAFSDRPIGVDIEKIRSQPRYLAISDRFFHPLEKQWLSDKDEKDFFTLWTAKEAYVKFTGSGIDKNFNSFSVIPNLFTAAPLGGAFLHRFDAGQDYAACLCDPCSLPPVVLDNF